MPRYETNSDQFHIPLKRHQMLWWRPITGTDRWQIIQYKTADDEVGEALFEGSRQQCVDWLVIRSKGVGAELSSFSEKMRAGGDEWRGLLGTNDDPDKKELPPNDSRGADGAVDQDPGTGG